LPRLFTGLELPSEIATELAMLRGGVSGARWVEANDYHITLRFIGDIDERMAGEAAEALEEIGRPSIPVALESLSWFGGDKPRAIVAMVKPTAALLELQADQERRLRRIGLPPETRKFEATRYVLFSARESMGGGPYLVEAAYPLQGPDGQ
jgi:2'-5' RNA ligase